MSMEERSQQILRYILPIRRHPTCCYHIDETLTTVLEASL